MNEPKRRKNPSGSHASLGGRSLRDEMEMHSRSRPNSGAAWSDDCPGQDDVDFNPRAPAGVDMPAAMEAEPYNLQARVTQDVRADGPKNQPVDCFTRFKRVIRGRKQNLKYVVFFVFFSPVRKEFISRGLF